jgi:PKD repeat protein
MRGEYLSKCIRSTCAVVILVFIIGVSGPAAGSEVADLLDERAIAISIGFGESLSGEIASTGYMSTYTFHAEANDSVYIRMGAKPSSLEPMLILMGPDGVEINRTQGYTLAELHEILGTDGTYTILAGDDGYDTGAYGLFLQRTNNPGDTVEIVGKNVNGTVSTTGGMQTFTFTAGSGDAAYVRMGAKPSSLEPMLILFGPDGVEIARTQGYTLAELHEPLGTDGTYTILAGDDGYDTGAYGIFAQVTTDPVNAALLQSGENTTGVIAVTGGMDTYRFAAAAGKKCFVRMGAEASSLEPMLILFGPEGEEINRTQGYTSAEIDEALGAGGMYTLLAGDDGYDTGSYGLYIWLQDPPVPVVPFPGYAEMPTDPDGDGLYEDVDGNGIIGFNDVVVYYANLRFVEENEPLEAFDYDGNGKIGFNDVIMLYGEVP